MFLSEDPLPLINHWESFDEFLLTWDVLYKMSQELSRPAFGKAILSCEIPEHFDLSSQQAELKDPTEFKRQACFLLSFFDSLSDYFDYEVEMMERGYPVWRNAA